MRLRQLLSIVLVLALSSMVATAATSELKNVSVASQGKSTTLTLITTGAFGHNEYRASDNLLLVDLTGVTAGKLKDRERSLQAAGVTSYHVVSYKGIGGVDVTRLELRVSPDATVTTSEVAGGLQVAIASSSEAASSLPKPESAAGTVAQTTAAAPPSPSAGTAKIQSVSVVRGKAEMAVEVSGTAPLTAKVLKLSSPDRLVLDIPNSAPVRTPTVAVNSGNIKAVRTSRYQVDPPVTRVVVDLLAPQDYELSASGHKLLLKLQPVAVAKNAPIGVGDPGAPAIAVAPTVSAENRAEKQESKGGAEASVEAKPVVFVEPNYQPKQQENGDPATAADRKAIAQPNAPVQMAKMQEATPVAPQTAPAPAQQKGSMPPTAASLASGAQSADVPKYTGEPIDVNLKDVDVKDFFRLIHEISGLNVVLDPGVSGSLTLVLSDVPWDQALDIVLKNNSFDKQLQGNVLRISTIDNLRKEAQAKRLQLEAESLAVPKVSVTRFLSYARAKDVMPTVKKLLSTRGDIIADDRMNALVIQDIPDVVPDVDRLIGQLDRKTQEVDIEARVVAATRSFKRELGAMVAVGWGNGPTAVGGGVVTTTGTTAGLSSSPIGGSASAPKYILDASQTKIQSIPVVSNLLPKAATSGIALINETNSYRLDVILAAAESRGLLKILSRPHVVTQNNIQAVVKQGMRIPIVTSAQLSGPSTVQYIEAVLRLTVTPQITIDNTIFLNIDIENTQPDFGNTISGNPVFLTQQATTQILVTDGGTVMIGGVIQTQNSVNTEQVPYLGNIPILGNLFKKKSVDNTTQELIFIITPKIVQT